MTPLFRCRALAVLCLLMSTAGSPVFADMILVSELRAVTVGSSDTPGVMGPETRVSSPGTSGPFAATVSDGVEGAFMEVHQSSFVGPDEFNVRSEITWAAWYPLGGHAEATGSSLFQVILQLTAPTPVSITGVSNHFSGNAELFSHTTGRIPLVWGTDPTDVFGNHLEFSQVLPAGTYTFGSIHEFHVFGLSNPNTSDGLQVHWDIALRAGKPVPESGSFLTMLASSLLGLAIMRRLTRPASLRRS